jgi:hypothetical protein
MTTQDLQRIRGSTGWREHRFELFHDTNAGSAIVKGRRPARPAWRCQFVDGLARLARLPLLEAVQPAGGRYCAAPAPGAAAARWRRQRRAPALAILQMAARLMQAADIPDDNNPATGPKVNHARHH